MTKLEDIQRGVTVEGILPNRRVRIIDVKWHGDDVLEVTYKDESGALGSELILRNREHELKIADSRQNWSFDADGKLLRLVSEACRIRLAWLFDAFLAVHTSLVEPLPHQITAVYGEMLPRQPLRFLLADDPGSGKTIMAGLLIKELIMRGDVRRCLIVCPGNLTEQWQEELYSKFSLNFELITRERVNACLTGNPFEDTDLSIGRLDHLCRNDDLLAKLEKSDWDMIVCDEAHKMSATYFGGDIRFTKRYRLGRLLSRTCRHFLLMTATPHNGKEQDFQLFMALLDEDRFEGRFRDGVHVCDTSDLMRRMVKERLTRFDGTPLFPERRAYTLDYALSDAEARLYKDVTDYVREEFNRADALGNDTRKGNVGFALTILQRRLASSPEAIYQSLRRRRKKLEQRLREEELLRRGAGVIIGDIDGLPELTPEDIEALEDAPDAEVEKTEELIADRATAARTIGELKAEIEMLKRLEAEAALVRQSGEDRKWEELSALLHECPEMFSSRGERSKLVIFTEHKDTLTYLVRRIGTLIGSEAVTAIHGGMGRDARKKAEYAFTQDKTVTILAATDAAGEGINLQRAHLMVNYDLPWNPNRLEQRFGRIHRIGQTEVCHLWNLVAGETREGYVFQRLCEKLAQESAALQGQVFDVLGQAFKERSLRELLVEAIRYGDREDVRARLSQVIDKNLDSEHLRSLIENRALAHEIMDITAVRDIRDDMERAQARRLQPHFIRAFFLEGFERMGGRISPREQGRFEISHVPGVIRNRDRQIGGREPVLRRYQRVTFHKENIHVPGKPEAAFICPGHPLLNALTDLILERERSLLREGAVLIDPQDPGESPRALFYLEHAIQDANTGISGGRRVVSRQMRFVEISSEDVCRDAGYAPYLDYRPVEPAERMLLEPVLAKAPAGEELEHKALSHAIAHIVPGHFENVRRINEVRIKKIMAAVKERLTKEIYYWDHRAQELKLREEAGKQTRLPWFQAQQRADDLQERLRARMEELEQSLRLSPAPPVVIGGALVIPAGLLARLRGERKEQAALFAKETRRVELAAMNAVMRAEKEMGNVPRDVSAEKCGWDIESRDAKTDALRFIEVKGRIQGSETVTVTKNEILACLNKPDQFILAIAIVPRTGETPSADPWKISETASGFDTDDGVELYYIRRPFDREPGFAEVSVNFNIDKLVAKGEKIG